MNFNFRIAGAIVRKDAMILLPLVLLTVLLLAGDVFFTRLELLSLWASIRQPLIGLSVTAFILSLFQLDSPVGLTDDWLCRPVPRRELLAAKLLLILCVLYVSRATATFIVDLVLNLPLVESLQDALLLQDPYVLLPLPVLLIAAMVTRNLVQGIGTLIALFVCVLVPATLTPQPGPLSPGIGEAMGEAGLEWIMLVPAKIAPLLLLVVVCWLVYWRKQIAAARALLVVTTCVTVLSFVLPMWILPWGTVYSLQRATLPESANVGKAVANQIGLRSPRACFPATPVGNLSTDTAFSAARQFHGVRLWSEEVLRAAGPSSLAFFTSIEVTSLPLDWRAKLNYVQIDYLIDGARMDAAGVSGAGPCGQAGHCAEAQLFVDAAQAAHLHVADRRQATCASRFRSLQRQRQRFGQQHRRGLLQRLSSGRSAQRRIEWHSGQSCVFSSGLLTSLDATAQQPAHQGFHWLPASVATRQHYSV
jgi:hypothetical protein